MQKTFVDIGRVQVLRVVKGATKANTCVEVAAVGDKGEFRFCLWPRAYSRGRVTESLGQALARVHLIDVGVQAFLRQLQRATFVEQYVTKLKEGDEIPIDNGERAWEFLKKFPNGCDYDPKGENSWVNCESMSVDEPDYFRKECLLMQLYQEQDDSFQNNRFESDRILKLFDDYGFPVSTVEYDFMMDWYEVTATAARTINNHVRFWKDCKPNEKKIAAFFDFERNNKTKMEWLCGQWGYAKHLWDRKLEIYASRAEGWRKEISKVELYRISQFGRA